MIFFPYTHLMRVSNQFWNPIYNLNIYCKLYCLLGFQYVQNGVYAINFSHEALLQTLLWMKYGKQETARLQFISSTRKSR